MSVDIFTFGGGVISIMLCFLGGEREEPFAFDFEHSLTL
jgi:hypothetical protein